MKDKAIFYFEAYQKYLDKIAKNFEKTIKEELGIDVKFEEPKELKNEP